MCFVDHKFVIILQIFGIFRYDAYTIPMTPATRLDITTNANETYNLVTQGGVGGGGGGGRGGEGGQQGIQPRSALSQQAGGSHEDAYDIPAPPPLQSGQGQRGAGPAAGAASGGGEEGGTGEEEVVYLETND